MFESNNVRMLYKGDIDQKVKVAGEAAIENQVSLKLTNLNSIHKKKM